MRRLVVLALAVLAPAAALASVPPEPVFNLRPSGQTAIISFAAPPARVACDGREVVVVQNAPIHPASWQAWAPAGSQTSPAALPQLGQSLTFSVDAEGAVIDLKRGPGLSPWAGDEQAAAIAAWRFAPGAPAKGCKLDLTPVQTALADTAPAKLFELAAFQGRNTPPAVRDALYKAGNCDKTPRRAPETIAYPDLRGFRNKSAAPPWAGIRYSIDAEGAVRDVQVLAQSGDGAYADTAASSLAESRFRPGEPRTGCFATFSARPKTTPAPARPDIKAFERPGDACAIQESALNLPETKTFPPAYAKRGVEGWAIIRFDVAPWGQIGNVEIVAAQPSEAFGLTARNLVQSARPAAPATGYRGCLVPVIYAIPAPTDDFD